tara:strand:+ start:27525 stop:27734 length:210 start_codon:yes stop_codon:yes gene_type:complete
MKLEMGLDNEMVLQLLALGLDHEDSPIVIKTGFEPANIRVTQSGNAKFDLVALADEIDEELKQEFAKHD